MDIVGPSHLARLLETVPAYWELGLPRWRRFVGDPRVKLGQSELMVAALRKAGKPVDFVTFKGDGHGNQKWSNNLTMFRKAEDFLASCLGGRSSGFDFYQLGAWAF